MNRYTKRFTFFKIYLYLHILFLHTRMFLAYCFRQRMARGLVNGVLNETWTHLYRWLSRLSRPCLLLVQFSWNEWLCWSQCLRTLQSFFFLKVSSLFTYPFGYRSYFSFESLKLKSTEVRRDCQQFHFLTFFIIIITWDVPEVTPHILLKLLKGFLGSFR